MNDISMFNPKKSIRTTLFIDRSNKILEAAFFQLIGIQKMERPTFIRNCIFNHLNDLNERTSTSNINPSSDLLKNFSGISIVVSFSPKEFGFGDLYEKLELAGSSPERRIIVSQCLFDALLSSTGFHKSNSTGDDRNRIASTASESSRQMKQTKIVNSAI